jgi:agmatine deiminase
MRLLLLIMFAVVNFYSACDTPKEASTSKMEKPQDSKQNSEILYTMPEESEPHEGTWLQWPNQYQYGETYSSRLNSTWVEMTAALIKSENVHLIVYDENQKQKVEKMLNDASISMEKIDFSIYKTDDVWVRDNGPIYVKDSDGNIVIEDWGFNGWGEKANFENCDDVPKKIAQDHNTKNIDLNEVLINEGGSVEIDGNGTLMACKSSIINANRNPKKSVDEVENIFTKYLGVTNFIWLEGKAGLEITDMHIDGFARFGNENTIVTMSEDNLLEWQVPENDIKTLYAATNKKGEKYKFVELPLTKNNVTTAYGKKLDYPGSYVNYYIANTVVLVPNYNDQNDAIANSIIQKLYPTRKVIGIDVRNLYANGGMIHCVTQQQPQK